MDLDGLAKLQTEGVNPRTVNIDRISTLDMCNVINRDDYLVAESVTPCLSVIASAVDALASRVRRGGRVIYVGAGTSGRLGILDASEIPPTFAAPGSQFVGLIAGGDAAIRKAQEGAEDNKQAGEDDLRRLDLDPELDSVIGIASSGRTPYVLGCLAFAKNLGCVTIGIACAAPSAMETAGTVDYLIAPLPGPEVVTGSTRLKAGTATKMVLNMLSTGTMIRSGKTYGNMMVDMVASNLKLEQRSRNILRRLSPKCSSLPDSELNKLLAQCNGSVKMAILVAETQDSVEKCRERLENSGGVLAVAMPEKPLVAETKRELVLCIDGGGSKCAAVAADSAGALYHGHSGPCNLADNVGNVDGVVTKLLAAAKDSLRQHLPDESRSEWEWKQLLSRSFKSVWLGLAGLDRSGLYEELGPRLRKAFGLEETPDAVRLTNDVDLLTAGIPSHTESSSAIVLIAGTGSVAMRYSYTEGKGYYRTARSGGWGHILGDEGGGHSIGLMAIQHTLQTLEDHKLGVLSTGLGEFELAIIKKLGVQVSESKEIDLLTDLLSRSQTPGISARIAGVAETVLGLTENEIAREIIEEQVSQLTRKTLGRLTNPCCSGYVEPAKTKLILAGGLMRNGRYQEELRRQLAQQRLFFQGSCVVENAAVAGAEFLGSKAS